MVYKNLLEPPSGGLFYLERNALVESKSKFVLSAILLLVMSVLGCDSPGPKSSNNIRDCSFLDAIESRCGPKSRSGIRGNRYYMSAIISVFRFLSHLLCMSTLTPLLFPSTAADGQLCPFTSLTSRLLQMERAFTSTWRNFAISRGVRRFLGAAHEYAHSVQYALTGNNLRGLYGSLRDLQTGRRESSRPSWLAKLRINSAKGARRVQAPRESSSGFVCLTK